MAWAALRQATSRPPAVTGKGGGTGSIHEAARTLPSVWRSIATAKSKLGRIDLRANREMMLGSTPTLRANARWLIL